MGVTIYGYNSLNNYYKSLWDVYSQAQKSNTYISNVSGSTIFLSNMNKFAFTTDAESFATKKSSVSYKNPKDAFGAGKLSVKEYLLGMSISQST